MALIQPGDIFVRPYGGREIIHLYLERGLGSGKQPYIVLTGVTSDSTWNMTREAVERRPYASRKGLWRFVGTVPQGYIMELIERRTFRA
jgi:hypothetical protein